MALLFDGYDSLISLARSGFTAKAEVSGRYRCRQYEIVLFVTSVDARPDQAPAEAWLGALVATLGARRLTRHDRRQHVVLDGLLGHHDFGDVVAARDVVHHRQQDFFHDGPQATGARAAVNRLIGDRFKRVVSELQLDAVHLKEPGVLLDQSVLRFGQDLHQRLHVQVGDRGNHWETTDEFGDQTELDQVLRHHVGEVIGGV